MTDSFEPSEELLQSIREAEADCDAGRVYTLHRALGFYLARRGEAWPSDDADRPRKWSVLLAPRGFRWTRRLFPRRAS